MFFQIREANEGSQSTCAAHAFPLRCRYWISTGLSPRLEPRGCVLFLPVASAQDVMGLPKKGGGGGHLAKGSDPKQNPRG